MTAYEGMECILSTFHQFLPCILNNFSILFGIKIIFNVHTVSRSAFRIENFVVLPFLTTSQLVNKNEVQGCENSCLAIDSDWEHFAVN